MRAPATMLGYYRNPTETAATLRPGGWIATGDLGKRLPDGALAIAGRQKDMIIRSGFNVYPAEVEAALNSMPAIAASGVGGSATTWKGTGELNGPWSRWPCASRATAATRHR